MAEMTPTPPTEEVREAYSLVGRGIDFRRVAVAQGEAFYRWLAAREAGVLRDAADRLPQADLSAAEWLRDWANQIEREASA